MEIKLIKLLVKNGIIKSESDLIFLKPFNTNPFRNGVLKVYSNFKRKDYIIKRCTKKEINNLFLAGKLLSKSQMGKKCFVLKPIDHIDNLFLFEDVGKPLNKAVGRGSQELFKFITELNDFFINNGYFWKDLALRNLFYKNKKYIFIDFESFYPINRSIISKRYILFLKLNLIQNFDEKKVNQYINQLEKKYKFTNKNRKKDSFEKAGFELFSLTNLNENESFEILDSSTIDAEKPLKNGSNIPFEVGHIIDEVVSDKMSLLWTLVTRKIRSRNEIIFKAILEDLKEIINSGDKEHFKHYIVSTIVSSRHQIKEIIQKINQAKRYNDYKIYDEILISITKTLCGLVGVDYKKIHIIARGSYGECILTNKSDLDFEIVKIEKNKILPLLTLENFACEVLNNLGIDAEGTAGRPKEQDIKIKTATRDFFEFFELRLINGDKKIFNKYCKQFLSLIITKKMWGLQTKYEAKEKKVNNKLPFEEIRFIITKLALLNNKKMLPNEIFEKIKMCSKECQKKLQSLLKEAYNLRIKENENLKKAIILLAKMNKIRIKFNIAKNNFIIKNDKG